MLNLVFVGLFEVPGAETSKTYDLKGLNRKVGGEGGAPCGAWVKQRFGCKSVVSLVICTFAKLGFVNPP